MPLVVHLVKFFAEVEEDGVNCLFFVQCTLRIVDDFDDCVHGVPVWQKAKLVALLL
jgi:hypothetical protein